MSAVGYVSASLRHWGFTGQFLHIWRACVMYVMSLWCWGNIWWVLPLQAACCCHIVCMSLVVGFSGCGVEWLDVGDASVGDGESVACVVFVCEADNFGFGWGDFPEESDC